MSAGWQTVPFGKVVALQRGFDLPSDQRSTGAVPVAGSLRSLEVGGSPAEHYM